MKKKLNFSHCVSFSNLTWRVDDHCIMKTFFQLIAFSNEDIMRSDNELKLSANNGAKAIRKW